MAWDEGFVVKRELGDGRAVWIYPLMFTHSICIGKINCPVYDDRWCYADRAKAEAALKVWNPLTQERTGGMASTSRFRTATP